MNIDTPAAGLHRGGVRALSPHGIPPARSLPVLLFHAFLIPAFLIIGGCSSSKPPVSATQKPPALSPSPEQPTPMRSRTERDSTAGTAHSGKVDPSASKAGDTARNKSRTVAPPPEGSVSVMGYRVQVYTGSSYDDAVRRRTELAETFGATPADIVFDPPYYKIRIGGFRTKPEAERYRDTLRAAGIPEAWVVRAPVKVPGR